MAAKLESLPTQDDGGSPDTLGTLVHAFNHNVERLNGLLFADQDFAVIGERR